MTISTTYGQRLLIFQHSRKPFLRILQNDKPYNEVNLRARVIDRTSSANVKTVCHKAKYYYSPIASFFQTGNKWIHLYEDTATNQTDIFVEEY